jgi:hypothetical protein
MTGPSQVVGKYIVSADDSGWTSAPPGTILGCLIHGQQNDDGEYTCTILLIEGGMWGNGTRQMGAGSAASVSDSAGYGKIYES